jgi:hypothetical protein
MNTNQWPRAELGNIQRLRVLAAGLPGTALGERIIDAPFPRVWAWVADLEHSVPTFDANVASLRIIEGREPSHRRVRTRSTFRGLFLPLNFDVDLEDGWCWMVSRPQLYVVGMAAEPNGDRTHWAQLEGFAGSAPSVLRPVLAATRWRHRRHVLHDIDGIARAVSGPGGRAQL